MSGKQSRAEEKSAKAERFGMRGIIIAVETAIEQFKTGGHIRTVLPGKERLRLYGAGVKNFGFIKKAFDIARANPRHMPPLLTPEEIERDLTELEEVRQLYGLLNEFSHFAGEYLLLASDRCFRKSLRIYDSLREQTRNRIPGAEVFYESLAPFFRRRKKAGGAEPTEKELKRDVKRLLRSTAEGTVEITNVSPRTTAGKRVVVDEVNTGEGGG